MTPQPPQPPLRSCVLVGYLGATFCAACALGKRHGSKQCGSVLHHHRDNGAGANSQAQTANHTLSLGAPRQLSMELRLPCHGGGAAANTTAHRLGMGAAAEVEFNLEHGTEFYLDPNDEMHLPRAAGDGSVAMGSYYHGMTREVADDAVSVGCVFRDVHGSAEVDVATDNIILDLQAKHAYVTRRMPRGLNHQPSWAEGFHGTRATAMQWARQHWASEEAGEYAASMKEKLTVALAQWTHAREAAGAGEAGQAPTKA
jgi:hypothetical protein